MMQQITVIKQRLQEKQAALLESFKKGELHLDESADERQYNQLEKEKVQLQKEIDNAWGYGEKVKKLEAKYADLVRQSSVLRKKLHSSKKVLDESQEHEFIKNELAKKDVNTIRIEKHPESCHVIVDKADKEAAKKVLKHHGLDKDYIVKTNEGLDEAQGSVHVMIKKHQKEQVHAALKAHNISHSSYPVDAQHHGISYDAKDAPRIRTALTHFNPVEDNSIGASDKVRTTDFDRVASTAAKVKRRSDIQKAINRRKLNDSWDDITSTLSEDVDVDAIRKLSAAIKANPEIESALFQLISAIMTNPKMFEANPTSLINKVAMASKIPTQKLQAVVDALGIN